MEEQLAQLKDELKRTLAAHYKRLNETVDDIYGYAVYTDGGVSSLAAVANRTSTLTVDPSDKVYNYYRYGAVEWSQWDDFGLFDTVNQLVQQIHDIETIDFADKRQAILRVALEALVELDSEGTFGPQTAERFLVVCVADSDDPIMLESAEQLNTPSVAETFRGEFG